MDVKGIDVSKWNGNINWKKVKSDGIDFAIIRAGYGKNNIDPYFVQNVKNAKEAGVKFGLYWFSYALDENQAKAEADYCINTLESTGCKAEYPIYFDYEYDSAEYSKRQGIIPNPASVQRIVRAFCNEIEVRGYWAGFYANLDYLASYGLSNLIARYAFWLAQWSSKKSIDCGIWQYSSTGKVNGISGNVDMNVCYFDYPGLIKKAKLNKLVETYPYGKASQTGIIKKGAKGEDVRAIQYALTALGYGNEGTIKYDGIFNDNVEKAVKAFQKDKGISADGAVGDKTRAEFNKAGY